MLIVFLVSIASLYYYPISTLMMFFMIASDNKPIKQKTRRISSDDDTDDIGDIGDIGDNDVFLPDPLERATNAKAFIVPAPNTSVDGQYFIGRLQQTIDEGIIRINFGVNTDLNATQANTQEQIKRVTDTLPNAGKIGKHTPNLINIFKNTIKKGDDIIIGQGKDKALFVATIKDDYMFLKTGFKNPYCGVDGYGYKHSRALTNIEALPTGTKIGSPCIPTLKLQPKTGWNITF